LRRCLVLRVMRRGARLPRPPSGFAPVRPGRILTVSATPLSLSSGPLAFVLFSDSPQTIDEEAGGHFQRHVRNVACLRELLGGPVAATPAALEMSLRFAERRARDSVVVRRFFGSESQETLCNLRRGFRGRRL